MRVRQFLVPAVTAALLLTGIPVTAAPPTLPDDTVAVETVVLPGGDEVRLRADGGYAFTAGPGREGVGHRVLYGPDGDLTVVPLDAPGTADPRRYNVTALAHAGQADAAAAPEPTLDDGRYAGWTRSTAGEDGTTTVVVDARDRRGRVPDSASGTVMSVDGSTWDSFRTDDGGTGIMQLPPGQYVLVADVTDLPAGGRPGENTTVFRRFTVGTATLSLAVSAVLGTPVAASTEQPAAPTAQTFGVGWGPDGSGPSTRVELGGDYRLYAVPATDADLAWSYQPTLRVTGTTDLYRLTAHGTGSIPADLVQRPKDAELAAVAVDYPGLGRPWPGARLCFTQVVPDVDLNGCTSETVDLPTTRTEYLSAGPDLLQSWNLSFGAPQSSGYLGYSTEPRTFAPGTDSMALNQGVIGFTVDPFEIHGDKGEQYATGMYRQGDLLYFSFRQFETARPDLYAVSGDQFGTPLNNLTLVTKDGAEINRLTGTTDWFDTGLEPGSAGRYRVTIDSRPDLPFLGAPAAMTLDWSFDTAPAADPAAFVPLAYSAVVLDATGVRGGAAQSGAEQTVTLDYVSQGPDATARTLTLEVSYDAGATWAPAALDRSGDHATAILHHPAGATGVSLRTTATDDRGSAITQSLIGAYALV